MYFLVALICTIISGLLWFFFRDRKALHLEVLTITFGSATLMWLVDSIAHAIKGDNFLSFTPIDGWISGFTFIGAIFFWIVLSFILNNGKKPNS